MRKSNRAVITETAAIVNGARVLWENVDVEADAGIRLDIALLGAGVATGVLQFYLQDSNDGGQTWDDVIASNTFAFAAALVNQRFAVALQVAPAFTQGSAPVNQALTAGTTRPGPLGSRVRLVEKVSGVSGTPTGPTYRVGVTLK